MIDVKALNRAELAALVCETLSRAGIDAVLVGGSCVSIYTHEKFVSLDLDFIALGSVSNKMIGKALAVIGFEKKPSGSRYFVHPQTSLYVEFPPSPLMVGDEHIPEDQVGEFTTDQGVIRLLRPTDCVKDRLANYYYHNDEQCYLQAQSVAQLQRVDWDDIQRWHDHEGQGEAFAVFRRGVESVQS